MHTKFKFYVVLLSILSILIFSSSSCNYIDNQESEHLTYYCVGDKDMLDYSSNSNIPMLEIIKEYNHNCTENGNKDNVIEVIFFESEDQMNTKLSTELMAGGGPDVISLDQKLPFEKLIEGDTFADINELIDDDQPDSAINFDNYNSAVMNTGIYHEKRIFIPLYYTLDVVKVNKSILDEYKISTNTDFTYHSLETDFEYYRRQKNRYPLYDAEHRNTILYLYIDSFVDLFRKKSDLDSDEFKSGLDTITETVKYDMSLDKSDKCVLEMQTLPLNWIIRYLCYDNLWHSEDEPEGDTTLLLKNINSEKDKVSAYIQCAFAVNGSAAHKEKVLDFIKFALDEKTQEYFSGVTGEVNHNYESGSNRVSLPVNNTAFAYTIKNFYNIRINNVDNKEEKKAYIKNILDEYLKMCTQVDLYSLYNYENIKKTYYNSNVIGKIVDNYINGKIAKEKFIRQLISATNIYLSE